MNDYFLETIRLLMGYFNQLNPAILVGQPRTGKPGFQTENFLYLEIRSENQRSFVKVYDPLRKTPRIKGAIVLEWYNQTVSPSSLTGETTIKLNFSTYTQKDVAEFIELINTLLKGNAEKKDLTKEVAKFFIQVYDQTL